ncbi:MAG: hypothetical protein ACI3V2_09220 [Faecousia sp.]
MNKTDNRINRIILFETLVIALIVLSTLLKLNTLVSLLFSASFLLVLLHLSLIMTKKISELGVAALMIAFASFICVLINAFIKNVSISPAYFKDVIFLLSTIFYLYIADDTSVEQKTAEFILKANLLIALLFPLAFFSIPYEKVAGCITLNFTNSNLTGLWLYLYIVYAALSFIALRGVWRIAAAVAFGLDCYLLILTQARNAMLAALVALVLFLLVRFKKTLSFSNTFLLIINLLPLLVVPLYLLLIQPIIDKGWLDFLISPGKALDSRVTIWRECFEKLKGSWLFGNYAELSGNRHNADMVLLCSYGMFVLIGVLVYLYVIMRRANRKTTKKTQLYALAAFISVLFMGTGEGALFSGGIGIYLPACSFLLLANGNYELPLPPKPKKAASKYRRY